MAWVFLAEGITWVHLVGGVIITIGLAGLMAVMTGLSASSEWQMFQLWRNGGAGAMYKILGQRTDELLIVKHPQGARTLMLAYRMRDTRGIGAGRFPLPGAQPVVFYLSIDRPSGWGTQVGIKLNHPVQIGGKTYCKLSASPWRR